MTVSLVVLTFAAYKHGGYVNSECFAVVCVFYLILLQVRYTFSRGPLIDTLLSESMKSNRVYVSSINPDVQLCDFKS